MTAGWKVRSTSYTSALWYRNVERGSWYFACVGARGGGRGAGEPRKGGENERKVSRVVREWEAAPGCEAEG